MGKSTKSHCVRCNAIINTRHVYSENDQVFLKKETNTNRFMEEEWFPINFQWIPVLQLQELMP